MTNAASGEPQMFKQVPLANTGLKSARLGIGAAYGLKANDIVWAVENGVNYVFWGSFKRSTVPRALKILGPAKREKMILVVPCYSYAFLKRPAVLKRSLQMGLRRAKTDYADVFHLGWLKTKPPAEAMETVLDMKEAGLIRHVGFSTHNRLLAAELLADSAFDFFMIRYNAANRGAEAEIFPFVDPQRNVIVNFTATRWGQLLKEPRGWPDTKYRPTAVDCYRFVLSRPEINICLTGAKNKKELEDNLTALELGPMTAEELDRIREFGDFVYKTKSHLMEAR